MSIATEPNAGMHFVRSSMFIAKSPTRCTSSGVRCYSPSAQRSAAPSRVPSPSVIAKQHITPDGVSGPSKPDL
jgi:hypothetical protein